MTAQQRYVAGSNVPGFFVGRDFYPDPTAPDDTDMSAISGLKHIQFRLLESGTPVTVEATVVSRTVRLPSDNVPTSHVGLLVAPAAMAGALTRAGKHWFWRFETDLAGDGLPCYSEWQEFTVY